MSLFRRSLWSQKLEFSGLVVYYSGVVRLARVSRIYCSAAIFIIADWAGILIPGTIWSSVAVSDPFYCCLGANWGSFHYQKQNGSGWWEVLWLARSRGSKWLPIIFPRGNCIVQGENGEDQYRWVLNLIADRYKCVVQDDPVWTSLFPFLFLDDAKFNVQRYLSDKTFCSRRDGIDYMNGFLKIPCRSSSYLSEWLVFVFISFFFAVVLFNKAKLDNSTEWVWRWILKPREGHMVLFRKSKFITMLN